MTPTRSQKHGISNVSSPLPLSKLVLNALPSSAIVKDKLIPVERVIQKYPKLEGESKAGTLACKLAREAIYKSNEGVHSRWKPRITWFIKQGVKGVKKGYVHTISSILEESREVRTDLEKVFGVGAAVV